MREVKSKPVNTDNTKLGISYILLLNSYIVKTDEISNLMIT